MVFTNGHFWAGLPASHNFAHGHKILAPILSQMSRLPLVMVYHYHCVDTQGKEPHGYMDLLHFYDWSYIGQDLWVSVIQRCNEPWDMLDDHISTLWAIIEEVKSRS